MRVVYTVFTTVFTYEGVYTVFTTVFTYEGVIGVAPIGARGGLPPQFFLMKALIFFFQISFPKSKLCTLYSTTILLVYCTVYTKKIAM